jgi:hypothetical protein
VKFPCASRMATIARLPVPSVAALAAAFVYVCKRHHA